MADAHILAGFVLFIAVVLIGAIVYFTVQAIINRLRHADVGADWHTRIIARADAFQMAGPPPAMSPDERMRVSVMGKRSDDNRSARTLAHIIDAIWGDDLTAAGIPVSASAFHRASGLDAASFYRLAMGHNRATGAIEVEQRLAISAPRIRQLHKAAARVRPSVYLAGADLIASAWSVTALRRRYARRA